MGDAKPVAWGAWSDFEQRIIAATTDQMNADTYDGVGDITIVPLYPASAIAALSAENERLREFEEDAVGLKRLFEQQWKRTREAGELWRQAHPGNDSVSPDLGELVKWLMDRATAAEARLAEAERLRRMVERGMSSSSYDGAKKAAKDMEESR